MRLRNHTFAIAAAVLASALMAAASAGALEDWNQARVTALSADLAGAVKQLRQAERSEPRPQIDPQEQARRKYMDTLKALDQSARQLHTRLEAGEGREETTPIARKIKVLVRDAEVNGKKFLDTQHVMSQVTPTYDALEALAPYYFEPSERGTRDPMAMDQLEQARQRQGEDEGAE